jgi:hypothetical protein
LKENVLDGIKRVPEAFLRLLHGKNFGKQIVRIKLNLYNGLGVCCCARIAGLDQVEEPTSATAASGPVAGNIR